MRPSLLALLLLPLAAACAANAAPASRGTPAEEAAVLAVTDRLFDAMRAGDSTAARSVFYPGATMASVATRDGEVVLQRGSVDRFVQAIGTPHDEVWNEVVWNPEVQLDGDLATLWMDYAFFAGDTFSHCGIDTAHLIRTADGWKIFHLADTRRQEPCERGPGR